MCLSVATTVCSNCFALSSLSTFVRIPQERSIAAMAGPHPARNATSLPPSVHVRLDRMSAAPVKTSTLE